MSPERAPSLSPLRAGDDWSELAAAIFDHTPDFIWSADVEHFGLLTFNRAMRDWFRSAFGIELAVGKRPEDAFPPGPFVERWYEIYRTALREGRCETDYVSMVGSRTLRFELTLMRRPDGTPYAIAAFGRDLTDQRRAEDALRRREAFFRVLHEKSNDLAMVVGLDRSFKYVSESVLSYVGTTLVGTALFFALLGASEYFDEHEGSLASAAFGYATYAMLVLGPLFVGSLA